MVYIQFNSSVGAYVQLQFSIALSLENTHNFVASFFNQFEIG